MSSRKYRYKGRIQRLANAPATAATAEEWGDVRDGSVYLLEPELRLSTEIALATGRPLLLRGKPGSGKSSLAAFIARNIKARYYELVVTSRTQARDLLWDFDSVRKLSDAQARTKGDPPLNDFDYVEPGVLWWVLNRPSALRRGAEDPSSITSPAVEPNEDTNQERRADRAVVLIDEIDKADPDVPNGLLVPIGSSEFLIQETRTFVEPTREKGEQVDELLIVISTNETRELPAAFVRRCVVHYLEHPGVDRLVEIAQVHAKRWQPPPRSSDADLFRKVAKRVMELRDQTGESDRQPSTAEYLDAVRACRALGITVGSAAWQQIERVSLLKKRQDES